MFGSLDSVLQQLIVWATEQREIVALYLYGSHAHDLANALSDIDVAVLARDDLSRDRLWRLEDRCAARWCEAFDVRVLNLAPLPLRYQATANGRRLWALNVGSVAEIESLIWRQYWDIHPHLERDWKRFVQRVMEQQDETERQQYQATLAQVRAVHRRVREAAIRYADDTKE